MGQPTTESIYATLVALLSEQERIKVTYTLAPRESQGRKHTGGENDDKTA